MNVQTLPPGYKVAPWTPPEKIDSKMLADASAKVSLVYFPASRAGLKDRMYVEEILSQMNQIKK